MGPVSKSVMNKISSLDAAEKNLIGNIVDSYMEFAGRERELDFEMEME